MSAVNRGNSRAPHGEGPDGPAKGCFCLRRNPSIVAITQAWQIQMHPRADPGLPPFHRADKKVPFIDAEGKRIEPERPNGIKFESFIFDALGYAKNPVTLEVSREEEFSPVKNATGVDSPETAQRDLMETFASWLEEAGVKVLRNEKGALAARLEISPLYALDREEAIRRIPPDLAITDELLLSE